MRWTLPSGAPFVGNDAAKTQIEARLSHGAFPHAILIEGPKGSGRRTLAGLIAAAAVCEGHGDLPCGECAACRKVFHGSHPDVTVTGGDGEARSFHIDTVRELREQAYILPNEAKRRVFILCDVQAMTEQAQNALLKVLEEPPSHVVFILTCEQRAQVLETVLSRVFPVALSGVTTAQATQVLSRMLPDRTEEELSRAAALWGGVIGQAAQGLQDGAYQDVLNWIPQIIHGIVAPTELALLKATAVLEKNKDTVTAVMGGLQLVIRDALCARYPTVPTLSTHPDAAKALAAAVTERQLLDMLRVLEELQTARFFNINHTLFLTTLCARLRQAAGR